MEKLDFPVELNRVRTYNKDGKPWEEGYLFRQELTALKTAHEITDTVRYEKPTQTLPVYFESAYIGDMNLGEVLDLRKSGSGLYIDPPTPDCLEGSTMLAATTSSELYPKGIFYLYDHLGNTRVTFQPAGTSCVNVTNYSIRYLADYYPYGKLLRSWQSSSQEKYLTTQHERDQATGLDFRNARYYDSETMRFYGVDNLSDDPNQVDKSPFVYTWGNPVNLTDPDGNCPSCFFGAIVGGVVEYGSQVVGNLAEGKDVVESLTDIDIFDVAVSTAEGFVTSGTSAGKSVVRKAAVKVGSEILRNTIDVKKEGVKVNNTKSVVRNTAIGLAGGAIGNKIPSTKIKVKAEVSPKQAVKAARETKVVNRAGREEIEKKAKKDLKEAKAMNKTANRAAAGTASGGATETTKRKIDKKLGNGN